MEKKRIQRILYFSSQETKELIESRLEDISQKSSRSIPCIIEEILLDNLLPKNEEAKKMIIDSFCSGDMNGKVKKILGELMAFNSVGTNWYSRYNNFSPIIDYCLKYAENSRFNSQKIDVLHHFLNQFESIVQRIEKCSNYCIELYDKEMYLKISEWAKQLYKDAKEGKKIIVRDHFELIKDCWSMFDDWTITYRYLMDLVSISEFPDDNKCRCELIDVIDKISKDWK